MPKKRSPASRRPTATPDTPAIKLAIPLPDDGIGSELWWCGELEESERRLEKEISLWQTNIQRYKGQQPNLPNVGKDDTVVVNADFYNVEQKKDQLFYQTPEVQVAPNEPQLSAAAPLVKAVINNYLGPDEIDAKRLTDEVLFDILCPAGVGPTKVGYDRVQVDVTVPTERIDPLTQLPAFDEMGQPETTVIKKTIWSQYYWRRISPADFRRPVGFLSTRWDEAPWLAFDFKANAETLERDYNIDAKTVGDLNTTLTLAGPNDKEFLTTTATGTEIWYKAHVYDVNEKNPERYRRLVIIKGRKGKTGSVICHENSPYQVFSENGELLQGMRGNPLHPFSIRVVSDDSFPPSDCTISRNQVDEISKGRSQMMKQRDRNVPVRFFSKTGLRKETVSKLERGDIQAMIGVDGPVLDENFKEAAQASFPQENFAFNSIAERDVEKLWALGANQLGLQQDTGRTATELNLVQQGADTRLAGDRGRFIARYMVGVEKLFALIQMFADHEQIVPIIGDDGTRRLETWDKSKIQGRYAFTIKPDSSQRTNAAEERELTLRAFNVLGNHPMVNSQELLKLVAQKLGLDPTLLINAKPPEPTRDDKPKISINIKGDDLNPLMPQYANVIHLLELAGVSQMQPSGPLPNQVTNPHGGVAPVPPINQHDANLTGKMSGPRVQ